MIEAKRFGDLLAENTRLTALHEDLARSISAIRKNSSAGPRGWEHDISRDTRPSVALLYSESLEVRAQIDALAASRWVPAPEEVV